MIVPSSLHLTSAGIFLIVAANFCYFLSTDCTLFMTESGAHCRGF